MSVIDFKAAKKWSKIPKDFQKKLIDNVYCNKCGVTTIVNYTLKDGEYGVILEGTCKTCGA
jgi:transcription elongation factor Elf1